MKRPTGGKQTLRDSPGACAHVQPGCRVDENMEEPSKRGAGGETRQGLTRSTHEREGVGVQLMSFWIIRAHLYAAHSAASIAIHVGPILAAAFGRNSAVAAPNHCHATRASH